MAYEDRIKEGHEMEDFLTAYLERNHDYVFVGGTRYAQLHNMDYVSELNDCEYRPEKKSYPAHGPELNFGDKWIVMPDMFYYRKNKKSYCWVESKSSGHETKLSVEPRLFESYLETWARTGYDVYIAFFMHYWEDDYYLYMQHVNALNQTKSTTRTIEKLKVKTYYTWDVRETFILWPRETINKKKYIR